MFYMESNALNNMDSDFKSISELQKYLAEGCRVENVQPPAITSDAEINIVTVTVVCPDDNKHIIRAYKDEAHALREFVRLKR
jgi:hypothetical protein